MRISMRLGMRVMRDGGCSSECRQSLDCHHLPATIIHVFSNDSVFVRGPQGFCWRIPLRHTRPT